MLVAAVRPRARFGGLCGLWRGNAGRREAHPARPRRRRFRRAGSSGWRQPAGDAADASRSTIRMSSSRVPADARGRGARGARARRPSVSARRRGPAHGDLQGGRPPRRGRARFGLAQMAGTHAIGHTRMATESAVTTDGAHPFTTGAGPVPRAQRLAVEPQRRAPRADARGPDLRDRQRHRGRGRLSDLELREGASLEEALEASLDAISTASTPSSSAPRSASACCAIRSPASPR